MLTKLSGPLATKFRDSVVARGALATFAVRIYGAAIAYAIQIYLARSIGAEELGVYVFCWTWLSIIAFLTPLGFDTSFVRFLAAYTSKSDWSLARGALNTGHRVVILASLGATLMGLLIITVVDPSQTGVYSTPLLIAMLTVPVLALVNMYQGIARGFNWVSQVAAPGFAIRPTVFLLLSCIAIAVLGRTDGKSIVVATVIACVITLALQYVFYRRHLPAEIRRAQPTYTTRRWLRISIPMMLVASFELMLANTDIVMMGVIRGPAETGVYNVAVRTSSCLLFIFFAVSAFAAPKIAELFANHQRQELIDFSSKARSWVLIPTLVLAIVLTAAGPLILGVFGADFHAAYAPMLVLMIGVLARSAAGPVDSLLTMTGKERMLAAALGAATILNLIGNAILIPLFGGVGAACATAASVSFELWVISSLAARHTGYSPFRFRAK